MGCHTIPFQSIASRFVTPQSKLALTYTDIMPRLSNQNRAIAIGLLQAGTPVKEVARRVDVSPKAIRKLREKFHNTGEVRDMPKSGRPRATTNREDRLIVNRMRRGYKT